MSKATANYKCMKFFMKKMFGILLTGVLIMPSAVFAQTDEGVVLTDVPAPVAVVSIVESVSNSETIPLENVPVDAESPVAPDSVVVAHAELSPEVPIEGVQETANSQEMVEGDVLEDTANPETESVDELEIIEIVEATTTEEVIEVIPEPVVEETPVEEVLLEEPVLDVIVESLPPEPLPEAQPIGEIAAEVIELKVDVDPAYVVSLSGKTIPTKKKGIIGTSDLTVQTQTEVDAVTGVLSVSGSCASPYFVVLIFKNQTDYEADPRSFIVNRAYPCENGSYDYSIDRLPPTLPNGTYYLLIGEQGSQGSWTPATGLTEISINRSN